MSRRIYLKGRPQPTPEPYPHPDPGDLPITTVTVAPDTVTIPIPSTTDYDTGSADFLRLMSERVISSFSSVAGPLGFIGEDSASSSPSRTAISSYNIQTPPISTLVLNMTEVSQVADMMTRSQRFRLTYNVDRGDRREVGVMIPDEVRYRVGANERGEAETIMEEAARRLSNEICNELQETIEAKIRELLFTARRGR